MLVVVSYDISSDRRRYRLQRLLKGYGHRVQESVFECHLAQRQAQELQRRARALIHPRDDSVRYYPLCESCRQLAYADGYGVIGEEALTIVA
ncbi:MAG: CRISPR-associated endonuclease Cas2 [Candidatus Latescibacterota bacterium]